MTINLFDDQSELIGETREAMKKSKRVLLQSPTGSGKSVMASSMIASSQSKNRRSAFVVPRIDLIKQMSETFDEFDIKHSFVSAQHSYDPDFQTHICSAQSLVRRLDQIRPHVIFMDEAHIGGEGNNKIINHYYNLGAWVVGLSATPIKGNGRGMEDSYELLVPGKSLKWLIANGRLSDYKYFAPSMPDLTNVKTTAGDYNKKQLNEEMLRQATVTGDAVKHYRNIAMGRKAVVYNCSIEHSLQTMQAFRSAGIPAAHLDGTNTLEERRAVCMDFALGNIKILSTVDLITTGFDLKSQTGINVNIDCIIMLRPTKSLALYLQMVGRGLRMKDYPSIILDHAGNCRHHGLPCADRKWSLKGMKKANGGSRTPPSKQCKKCYAIHPPAPKCPECGFIYPVESREVNEVDGELEEISREQQIIINKQQQGMAKSMDDLIALGRKRGYKNPVGWAAKVYTARRAKA